MAGSDAAFCARGAGNPIRKSPKNRLRTAAATVVVILLMAPLLWLSARQIQAEMETCKVSEESCRGNPNIDLAVMLDRSGSLDPREAGKTYNIQVEGLARSMRDPSVIPRDGSVAISVFTFADQATLRLPLTEISSAIVAESVVTVVEQLRCPGSEPCPERGPNPGTSFGAAINQANFHLGQIRNERRRDARRVILMSTDGECSDPDCGQMAAQQFRSSAAGLTELSILLIGNKLPGNKANADRIVFPAPADDLPGATLSIDPNACTEGNGACTEAELAEQIEAFADRVRRVLRSHVTRTEIQVTSNRDLAPAGSTQGGLSLREAIEIANARGGETSITFNLGDDPANRLIMLDAPLPAICAPGITVDGCAAGSMEREGSKPTSTDQRQCVPVTIVGRNLFCDGMLIRSNRAVVTGLRIVGFSRAGITIAPISPADNVGGNKIERNELENNSAAGILVLDPPPDPENAVFHNERNSILGNSISGSRTPIDLGGDGRTANDDGDSDVGPNTLLNFPRIDSVERSPNGAIIRGILGDSSGDERELSNARVDVFAIAELGSPDATISITEDSNSSDRRLITAVTFLGQAAVSPDGSFEAEVGESPTCGYTVTLTDNSGNTSELAFPCRGFAKARMSDSVVFPDATAGPATQTGQLAIENTGCERLTLLSASARRVDATGGRITPLKDNFRFSVRGFQPMPNGGFALDPGEQRVVEVEFRADVPRRITRAEETALGGLPAREVLPRDVRSMLTITHSGGTSVVKLIAAVIPIVKLIHPTDTSQAPLLVLTRSGDSYFVEFSIYDSDLEDIDRGEIEFFDSRGRRVPVDNPVIRLREAIQARGLVEGQSFTVQQRFDNANEHPDTRSFRITVFGTSSGSSDTASSGGAQPAATQTNRALRQQQRRSALKRADKFMYVIK